MPISVASPRSQPRVGAAVRALVRSTLALEGRRPGEIAVVLSDDAMLRALNRQWRGLDRATDVLSFGYDDGDGPVSGDLVVSMDRLAEQARRYRVSRGRELARLVVHGALHLVGLDHRTASQRCRMQAREDRVLRSARAAVRALDAALRRTRP